MGKFKVGDRVLVDGGLYKGKATVSETELGGGYLLDTDGEHKGELLCGRLWQPELHLTALTNEFSVGDIVRGTSGNPYGVTNEDMTKGEVTYIGASGSIGVKVIEHKHRGWESSAFSALDPKHFELVTQAPKFKAGDKVKSKKYGNVYTLTERDYHSDGDRFGVAWKIEEGSWIGENQIELFVELPEAPVEEVTVQVGDFVTINPSMPDVTEGKAYLVENKDSNGVMIIDDVADPHWFTHGNYTKTDAPTTKGNDEVKFVKAIADGCDITEGTIYRVVTDYGDGTFEIIDDAGDEQYVAQDEVEVYEFVTEGEKPTTKNDVVDYLRKISADEVLEIIAEVRN
jgi:hypothetical protein